MRKASQVEEDDSTEAEASTDDYWKLAEHLLTVLGHNETNYMKYGDLGFRRCLSDTHTHRYTHTHACARAHT